MKLKQSSDHWDRLKQLVKVEEPITVQRIAKISRDIPFYEIDDAILEMVAAGVLRREFEENEFGRRIEKIFYGK